MKKKILDKKLSNYIKNHADKVKVTIDRPIGYVHHGTKYPINYGYIEGLMGGDGEEQDVYCLGDNRPLKYFYGKLIARIIREDDNEEKWVACRYDETYTVEEIKKATDFMEKWFKSEIIML